MSNGFINGNSFSKMIEGCNNINCINYNYPLAFIWDYQLFSVVIN